MKCKTVLLLRIQPLHSSNLLLTEENAQAILLHQHDMHSNNSCHKNILVQFTAMNSATQFLFETKFLAIFTD
ncbi:hypothetical protein BZZ01_18070 [Nostocales cyanobacterium HT-58-2]|nr:hypothetical protein BZZ01_18070 [Nostocales cyanobacterium HT-58-2]